uniref:hypothetical protein n=1 Tax=Cronobacter sakazakii TaxID=28141 RepID=UPI001319D0F5
WQYQLTGAISAAKTAFGGNRPALAGRKLPIKNPDAGQFADKADTLAGCPAKRHQRKTPPGAVQLQPKKLTGSASGHSKVPQVRWQYQLTGAISAAKTAFGGNRPALAGRKLPIKNP